jgi:hypothetical protein
MDWGLTPRRWFRDGGEHKASALMRLAKDMPTVSWVLVGDAGEHDLEPVPRLGLLTSERCGRVRAATGGGWVCFPGQELGGRDAAGLWP